MKRHVVITTINKKLDNLSFFYSQDWNIILIGDKKTPQIRNNYANYYSVEDQLKLNFKYSKKAPFNHYARKNIGYLLAIKNNADILYDTDDDNFPIENRWKETQFNLELTNLSGSQYINAYKLFTSEKIWPRGYPIDEIHTNNKINKKNRETKIGVWQGLADKDPDVDAIYRLIFNKDIKFERRNPVALSKESYCPFNSQNTLWNMELAPLLYLPSTVSFRFTDILRSYVAQRIMWDHGFQLGFMESTVIQDRNTHNLLDDLRLEYPMYLNTKKVINILEKTNLPNSLSESLSSVYKNLYTAGIVKQEELNLLDLWISDIERIH